MSLEMILAFTTAFGTVLEVCIERKFDMTEDVEVFWENGEQYVRYTVNGLLDGTQVLDTRGQVPRLVDVRSAEGRRIKRQQRRRRWAQRLLKPALAASGAIALACLVLSVAQVG